MQHYYKTPQQLSSNIPKTILGQFLKCLSFFCLIIAFIVCSAGYNEKRLLHDLLDTYNTLERPVLNESDPLQLSFGLTLMQIIDVVSKYKFNSIEILYFSSIFIDISTKKKVAFCLVIVYNNVIINNVMLS